MSKNTTYEKIDPNMYMDEVEGELYPDYSKIIGVPIKLGINTTTMELFDDITRQLTEDGLAEISICDDGKTLISFVDKSEGYPISRVVEDVGDGVMVTFNENGSLSPYKENEMNLSESENTKDETDAEIEDEFEEEDTGIY